jgi:hypothetical protein
MSELPETCLEMPLWLATQSSELAVIKTMLCNMHECTTYKDECTTYKQKLRVEYYINLYTVTDQYT